MTKQAKEQKLTLLEELDERHDKYGRLGLFECKCGNLVKKPLTLVRSGNTCSCGCSRSPYKRAVKRINLKHLGKDYMERLNHRKPEFPKLLIENMIVRTNIKPDELSLEGLVAKYGEFYCCSRVGVGPVIRAALREVLKR